MMHRRHSWEEEDSPVPARHSWETESDASVEHPSSDAGSVSDSDSECGANDMDVAGEHFRETLSALYMDSAVSAETLCVLCYWATRGGMRGSAKNLAKAPGAESGSYQQFLDKALGFTELRRGLYELPIIGTLDAEDATRRPYNIFVRPLHEALHEELLEDVGQITALEEAVESKDLPPTYFENPIVKAAMDNDEPAVHPLGLYLDAVRYTNSDSVLAVWLVNLISGARHVVALIRKRKVCDCGCHGWDTFYPLLLWLQTCFQYCANGVFPSARHDGSPWRPSDEWRAKLSGTRMKSKGALIQLRGDWSEFCERFGFQRWGSVMRPCFMCNSYGTDLYNVGRCATGEWPWELNNDNDFANAADRCLVKVQVTPENHGAIIAALTYKINNKSTGRQIQWPVAGLQRYDRLEPTPDFPDTATFDQRIPPFEAVFWRPARETLVLRTVPFWNAALGILPSIVTLDLMHCLLLGPALQLIRHVVWTMIELRVYCNPNEPQSSVVTTSSAFIRKELWQWYKKDAPEGTSRLAWFSHKRLGTWDNRFFKCKAIEARGMLQFLEWAVRKHAAKMGQDGRDLHVALFAMLQTYALVRPLGWRVSERQAQAALDAYKVYVEVAKKHELELPKDHVMMHLLRDMPRHGGAFKYAVFLDEALNLVLKRTLRLVHQLTFEVMGFCKLKSAIKRAMRRCATKVGVGYGG